MGMTLSVDDFKRVANSRLQVALGLFVQLFIAPLLAFIIAITLKLNTFEAVGLIILASCPGGAVSNLFSYFAKADTALSVTLTALSSLITVFTIPFIVNLGLSYFASEGVDFHLPIMKTILSISLLTTFPLLTGMLLKKIAPSYCSKRESAFASSAQEQCEFADLLKYLTLPVRGSGIEITSLFVSVHGEDIISDSKNVVRF